MAKFVVLMNHDLTEKQKKDVRVIGKEIVLMPSDLAKQFSQVPTTCDGNLKSAYVAIDWIKTIAEKGDDVLVQGEFGTCFRIATWCIENGLHPVHAVTERKSVETHNSDGTVTKTNVFEHVRFRDTV